MVDVRRHGAPAQFRMDEEHDAGEWTKVQNPRKAKIQAKRDQEEKDRLAFIAAHTTAEEAAAVAAAAKREKQKKQRAIDEKRKDKKSSQEKGKEKKKDPNLITNEAEMIALLTRIIKNEPKSFIDISNLGLTVQKLTGYSWNSRYKKFYGTLADFVQKKEEFHLEGSQVYLIDDWEPFRLQKAAKAQKKQRQKDRKEGKATPQQAGGESKAAKKSAPASVAKSSAREAKPQEGGSSIWLFLFLFFILLVVATYVLTQTKEGKPYYKKLIKLSSPYIKQIQELVKKYLPTAKK